MRFSRSVGIYFFLAVSSLLSATPETRKLYLRDEAFPGSPLTAWVYPYPEGSTVTAELSDPAGRVLLRSPVFPVTLTESTGVGVAILALPVDSRPGTYSLSIISDAIVTDRKYFPLREQPYPEERIPLSQQMTGLRSTPDPKKDEESKRLQERLLRVEKESVFHEAEFLQPVPQSRVSSEFGSRRVFLYSNGQTSTTWHYGTDYAVPVGTPVRASGGGRVVFAGARILTGNSVIIEHLPGVYSLYYHLDSISAAEGTMVRQNELLGLSGSTGLVTGPHLHFEFRISGLAVHPGIFLDRGLIDKSWIISIMNADSIIQEGR